MLKKIVGSVIIGLLVCLLLYVVPWRHKINIDLEGVQCRIGDVNYSEDIKVTVQGDYFSYLFKEDTFKGKILIDKYGDTLDGSWVSLRFHDAWAVLIYENNNNGKPTLNTVGSICSTSDFEQLLICVGEPTDGESKNWSAENGLFISASAETREEAIDIAEQLSAKSIWLSKTNWRSTIPVENSTEIPTEIPTEIATEISTEIPTEKSKAGILEQAIDWGNANLFYNKKYDNFTLQERVSGEKTYRFLVEQEPGFWECELYYVLCDGDTVKEVRACGGGNNDLFSYDVVEIKDHRYVAVYSASHMGNGNLDFYSLEETIEDFFAIDGVIDNHYEEIELLAADETRYLKSQVYENGKLASSYRDVNQDGFTDIILSGIIHTYNEEIGSDSEPILMNSNSCTRTYLYRSAKQQFQLEDEIIDYIYDNVVSLWDYTGYLDLLARCVSDNPKFDYDGDGTDDRIYKQYDSDTGISSFTMKFGNGTQLLLADRNWGMFFKTEAADLTGDGKNEILFEQFSISTKCINLYVDIYTNQNGTYERMKNPYEGVTFDTKEADRMLYLPLLMSKENDTTVQILQPDSGYQSVITTSVYDESDVEQLNEMEHLYFDESEGKVQNYQASEMKLVETGDNGRKALLLRTYLGDKWCVKNILWKLEYKEDKWQITQVYQTDPIRVALGTEYSKDINGDLEEEKIEYDTEVTEEHGFEYETPLLRINGIEYDSKYLNEKFGIYVGNCSHLGYYLLDIDVSDSYQEIAILDEGPSDDPISYFFQYKNQTLIYCGSVTGFPENDSFLTNGDGSITAKKRLNILHTWWADATWRFDQNRMLKEEARDFYSTYYYTSDENTQNIAKKDLVLYVNPDKTSNSVVIKKGETLILTATDNLNWIELSTINGERGWFYLNDSGDVTLPTGVMKVGDILTYLNMAD